MHVAAKFCNPLGNDRRARESAPSALASIEGEEGAFAALLLTGPVTVGEWGGGAGELLEKDPVQCAYNLGEEPAPPNCQCIGPSNFCTSLGCSL